LIAFCRACLFSVGLYRYKYNVPLSVSLLHYKDTLVVEAVNNINRLIGDLIKIADNDNNTLTRVCRLYLFIDHSVANILQNACPVTTILQNACPAFFSVFAVIYKQIQSTNTSQCNINVNGSFTRSPVSNLSASRKCAFYVVFCLDLLLVSTHVNTCQISSA